MEIPAFFAVYEKGTVSATDGYISGSEVRMGERRENINDAVSRGSIQEMRAPALIIDCNSFKKRSFSEKVMMNMKIRGVDIWMMTCINNVDDVFDSFYKDTEIVFAPYHMVDSNNEWRDICEISDSVIPTVFIHKGEAVSKNGKKEDVAKTLEQLVSFGFYKNCVLDMEGSLDARTWSVIEDDYPSTIPFVDRPVPGFENTIRPFMI